MRSRLVLEAPTGTSPQPASEVLTMTTKNVIPIRPDTVNELDAALGKARATLDLIYGLTIDTSGVALESLDKETLGWAMSDAIEHVDEAMRVAERLTAQPQP
jgi:hypothetical protein